MILLKLLRYLVDNNPFKGPPEDHLVRNIYYLERAIARNEDKRQEYFEQAEGACCPSCYHGGSYNQLCEKLDRQKTWLKVLRERAEKRRR